jgi:uncharacterized protein YndB with AHSA1/START domain
MEDEMKEPVVEVETTIAADRRTVWRAMTRTNTAMFPGAEIETDWVVGRPIRFTGKWEGEPFDDRGEVTSFKENEELSFTHWSATAGEFDRPESYHRLRYRLAPLGGKTRVTLSQYAEGKDTEIDPRTKNEFAHTWKATLEALKKTAETMDQ